LLTAGPWNTFTRACLVRMDSCGFAKPFMDIRTGNHAAMVRTAMHNSKTFTGCLSRLKASSTQDDASLAPSLRQWHKRAFVFQIEKAVDKALSNDARTITDLLPLLVPFDPKALLRRRLARWLVDDTADLTLPVAADKAMTVISQITGRVPYCVIAAVWRSWLNGWCTSRRFQDECQPCLFDSDCGGSDCLEHYSCCPAARRYLSKRLPRLISAATLIDFLMLGSHNQDDLPFLAVHVYAVYGALNHIRAGQMRHGAFDLDMLLWERWRAAMMQMPSLFHLVNERWRR